VNPLPWRPAASTLLRPGGIGLDWLRASAFWALAVAWPLFDVLQRHREFFVAHRAERVDIFLFTGVVSLAGPVAMAVVLWLTSRVSAKAVRVATAVVIGGLVSLLAANGLQRVSPPAILHLIVAGGTGVLAGALYASAPTARSFATWLSPAIVALPLLFVAGRDMAPFVRPEHVAARLDVAAKHETPIVFVVLDQLPVTSLVRQDDTIDPETYPGFAELAGVSTWYRNATTVGELTTWALPALLAGVFPAPGRLPTATDYPNNLFTALAGSYAMEAFEPITALCPPDVCRDRQKPGRVQTIRAMAADAAVVGLHIVAPPALAAGLPPLTEDWKGFADAQGFQERWASERDRDRRRPLNQFLDRIERGDPPRTLYYLHALLPHEPYQYLPGGQLAGGVRRMHGVFQGTWTADEWPVVQMYARHLLQVQFVDRFIGKLIARLRQEGLFDRALVVVTSDHGVSFVSGRAMKSVDRATAHNIVSVPLFVKRPFQRAAEVTDRNVQSVDVLPLVADLLDVALPFATDGRSPLGADALAPAQKRVFHAEAKREMRLGADELRAEVREMAGRRLRWFGAGPAAYWRPTVSPAAALLGRRVDDVAVEPGPVPGVSLDTAASFADVDPTADAVPVILSGRAREAGGLPARLTLAIAVNGRIESTTATYIGVRGSPDGAWTALVDPSAYRKGPNDVRVFVVRGERGRERLAATGAVAAIGPGAPDRR
jgi:hypothetical protein